MLETLPPGGQLSRPAVTWPVLLWHWLVLPPRQLTPGPDVCVMGKEALSLPPRDPRELCYPPVCEVPQQVRMACLHSLPPPSADRGPPEKAAAAPPPGSLLCLCLWHALAQSWYSANVHC